MSEPPDVPLRSQRRSLLDRVSIVWLIPVAALVIALGIAWQNWVDRGPMIEITFNSASGISPGETELRFRDVAVGVVEDVGFSSALDQVLVSVRMDKDIADYVDEDAAFWVVEPQVTARGVSGLSTVLSGVYIEGSWDQTPGGIVTRHLGQLNPPLLMPGEDGLRITLEMNGEASVVEGTPILYKGIEVGQIGEPTLSDGGVTAVAEALIRAPYDKLVTTSTRFWDTSGFSFSFGANGAALDFSSVASLISGGVTFETIVSGGVPAEDGQNFELFYDESTARSSLFTQDSGPPLNLSVVFDDNVSGLNSGAPVELRGVNVGEVANLTGTVNPDRFGDSRVRLLATLAIRPSRLGLPDATPEEALDFLGQRVEAGLRARLATASLLTGGLKVELLQVENAPDATLDLDAQPFPTLPTTQSDISDVSASAEGVLQRINDLPIEALIASAIEFLETSTSLVGDQNLRQVPEEVSGLLAEFRGLVGSDRMQALPAEVSDLVVELQGVSAELNTLLAQLDEAQAVDSLVAAIDTVSATAEEVGTSIEGVPALIDQLDTLAATANDLPLETLIARVSSVAASADMLLASESTQAVPAALSGALAEVQGTLAELRAADAPANLSAALASASRAADAVTEATAGVPELVAKIDALAASANALPLDALVAEITSVATSANALVGSDAAQTIPAELAGSLTQVRAAISELRAAGTPANLNRALTSASDAADAIAAATDGVPALVGQLETLAASANDLPLETLVARLTAVAASADTLIGSEGAQAVPAELSAALAEIRTSLADLREAGTADNLNTALASATDAADAIEAATAGVPDLVARLDSLAATADALPLDTLVTEITGLAQAAGTLVASDAAQTVPAELSGALTQIRAALSELRAAGTPANLNIALQSASGAADAIEDAASGVPALVARLDTLAATANDLPLETLVNEVASLADAAEDLVASEDAQALPASLNGALAQAEAALTELREGGAVDNLNATLASVNRAAASLEQASGQLPALVAQIEAVLGRADSTLSGLDANSELSRDARAALREVENAAEAVQSLARALERQPNSVILGR